MMELNKVWAAGDYRALTKRLGYAAGMIGEGSATDDNIRHLAFTCQLFLDIYKAKNADNPEALPEPRERFITY